MNSARDVVIKGNYAYVTGLNSDNLAIVDISDPTSPTLAANFDPNDTNVLDGASSIAVEGDYAYVTGFASNNLVVINISDPTNPVLAGNFSPGDTNVLDDPQKVSVRGDYAYVVGELSDSVAIIDISSSTNPTLATNFDPNDTNVLDAPQSVTIAGDYVYVTGRYSHNLAIIEVGQRALVVQGNFTNNGTFVNTKARLSMENSSSQELSGTMTGTSAVGNVEFSGSGQKIFNNNASTTDFKINSGVISEVTPDLIYNYKPGAGVMGRPQEISVSGSRAYVVGVDSDSLSIVNISDPASPTLDGMYKPGSNLLDQPQDVAVSGNYAYVTSRWPHKLAIIDISDPTSPTLAANWLPSSLSEPYGVAVSGNYAYVTGKASNNLMIADVSDPASPTLAANWTPTSGSLNSPHGVAVSGNYVYVVGNSSNNLFIIDISDPTNPVQTANFNSSDMSGAYQVTVSGNYAYVVTGSSRKLVIIDISDPANPTRAGVWETGDWNVMNFASHVDVSGNYAYVTGRYSGNLVIIDISDPTNPTTVDNWDPNSGTVIDDPTGVVIDGAYAYLTGYYSNNLVIVEVPISGSGNVEVIAPEKLSIAGDYINNSSTFNASTSEVTFNGTAIQTISGTLTGSSSFDSITIANTSEDGTNSQSVVFTDALQSTGTFTITPNSSVALAAGATSTFGNVVWDGGSTSVDPVWIYSTVDGNQANVVVSDTAEIYDAIIRDLNACGSTEGELTATSSIDSGNNSCFSFIELNAQTGSTTLTDHDATQVNNNFNFMNKTNEALFAFKLIPVTGTSTITNLTLTLSGAKDINTADFTNIRLYKDYDADANYDASDGEVSAGVMSLSGANGTITFSTTFTSTTTENYLVVADWNAPGGRSSLNIDLYGDNITATDENGIHDFLGSIRRVQHTRLATYSGGGGGNSSRVGTPAPSGGGVVTGGTNDGGEQIGSNQNFYRPTANSGSWTNASNAYDQTDGTYASANTAVANSFNNHAFVINQTNTIDGVEVKLEISGTTGAGDINVGLSYDGGTSWTSTKTTPALTTTDTVVTLGGPADTWGRTWTTGEFSNANFQVRLTAAPSANTVQVDAIQVRVYHQASGGGSSGGGRI
jgi:hypothetical protein